MTIKETLKKQIIYRSTHRGFKEMDILLGNFVNKHIAEFNFIELKFLNELLMVEDEILYNWYFNQKDNKKVPNNIIVEKLKKFKI